MDIETIDANYEQLQKESKDTIDALTALANKLKAASDGGDQNAREWMLDLKEIALSIQDEENQTTSLLQSIHDFVVKELQTPPAVPAPEPVPYQQAPQYQQPVPQQYQQPMGGGIMGGSMMGGGMAGGGGMMGSLGKFTGSGFGRAIVSGAGFGIGADLIGHLFR
ncbi:MAG TPA: hypothetical protein VKY26_06985 [Actinomycetota bacterium]|nr:hypothetical protein [Actinomycetota bacterium]